MRCTSTRARSSASSTSSSRQAGGRVLPIEVKSGKDYKRHSALSNALKTPNWAIEEAVVLCEENPHIKGPVAYLPAYAVMWL